MCAVKYMYVKFYDAFKSCHAVVLAYTKDTFTRNVSTMIVEPRKYMASM